MQLLQLAVPRFRNLRGMTMDFATHLEPISGAPADVPAKPIRSHVLIGQNGVGKSNLIEALITIFRDIDLDRDATFDYKLAYNIRDREVRIRANSARQKRLGVGRWADPIATVSVTNRELLPSHIFASPSGRNERIEALFQEHQRRFNRRQELWRKYCLSSCSETLPAARRISAPSRNQREQSRLRG